MVLNGQEERALQELLWQARSNALTPAEERRLRQLIAKQNPAAKDFPLAELVAAGLVVLGAILVLHALTRD
ncbi:MAG: hypothetical protein QOD77_1655 [Thermoplasmata archaeon]|jgi:hypothetical protein|nr:hypothetical protein [Thermoplasmata archaeon]